MDNCSFAGAVIAWDANSCTHKARQRTSCSVPALDDLNLKIRAWQAA